MQSTAGISVHNSENTTLCQNTTSLPKWISRKHRIWSVRYGKPIRNRYVWVGRPNERNGSDVKYGPNVQYGPNDKHGANVEYGPGFEYASNATTGPKFPHGLQ